MKKGAASTALWTMRNLFFSIQMLCTHCTVPPPLKNHLVCVRLFVSACWAMILLAHSVFMVSLQSRECIPDESNTGNWFCFLSLDLVLAHVKTKNLRLYYNQFFF